MELYTIRYNLYNYIFQDNFNYNYTKDYIFLSKYTIIMIFILLGFIFIYKIKYFNLIGFLIVFIIILFIYIIYFEIANIINDIENNNYLINYGNYYKLCNIIYNESYDFIEDKEVINQKIKNLVELLDNINENTEKNYFKKDNYLYIKLTIEDIESNTFNDFIRNIYYEYIIDYTNTKRYIKIDNLINSINEYKIENIFDANKYEYNYLVNKQNPNYYIEDNYLIIKINPNNNDLDYFKEIINSIQTEIILINNINYYKIDNIVTSKNSENIINLSENNIYLKLKINDELKQANNEYINYFLKLIINEFNNKYKEIYNEYKNDGINIYLKIKLIEINEEILKNNYYISTILYKIIDEKNELNIEPNAFIKYASDLLSADKLLLFLLEYQKVKNKIIYQMKYENNKINEEINNEYYNEIKKNIDLLKYIDIYKLEYVNKYLFIEEKNKLMEFVKIKEIPNQFEIQNKNYYLIDLKQFNNEFIKYINDKYEMNLKNLNLLFENKDPKIEIKIKELIKKFNNCYIKFIIVLIILITIICHIFYLEILR